MNEVEKMYRNSGIKKIELDYPDNFEPFYPEFTAEKQLELIKFISGWNMFLKNVAGQFNIATGDNAISYYAENLEDAICLCINSKWHLMNDKEKAQIKEILE